MFVSVARPLAAQGFLDEQSLEQLKHGLQDSSC